MYNEVAKLILYSDLGENSILEELCAVFKDYDNKTCPKDELIGRIYAQIKRILDLATAYGFNKNLWHNYLTFIIIMNENSFSMTCEGAGATDGGSVNIIAKNDFKVFKALFDFDFSKIEKDLGIDCFSIIENYVAIPKRDTMFNKNVSQTVQRLSVELENTNNADEFFNIITEHYKKCGVGMFGLNRAFRIAGEGDMVEFVPINNADQVYLSDLIGYERQKNELIANTLSFCKGSKANNVLLYGDAGTGKSTSVKAVLNEYYHMGLRMIEIYKHQFKEISSIISKVKNRNYKFIIFIDDLSFEENEVEYKFLKAVIEGGVESRPDNVLIYATSNRRHLIKETWNDRNDMEYNGDIHKSDTMEEKLSLSARFGVTINYSNPNRQEFYTIVKELAKKEGIEFDDNEIELKANQWEIRHGGVSGRTARQFVNYLLSKETT